MPLVRATEPSRRRLSRVRPAALSLFLVAALLAGCLGGDEEAVVETPGDEPKDPRDQGLNLRSADRTNIERELGAVQLVAPDDPEWDNPNITARDWLLLSVPTTAAGQIAAFQWQVPNGSLIKSNDESSDLLLIDIVLTLPAIGSPDGLPEGYDWLMLVLYEALDEADNTVKAHRVGMLSGVTQTVTVQPAGGSPTTDTEPPQSRPDTVAIRYDGLAEGDNIYFILAARGPDGGVFGAGVRVLGQEYSQQSGSPTRDWDDFHTQVGERTPLVPVRVGEAENLYMAQYGERHNLAGESRIITTADMAEPEEGLPTELYPLTTARVITLRTGTEWGGWSYAVGGYESVGEFGSWNVAVDLHGTEFSGGVGFVSYEPLVPESLHTNEDQPVFYGELEGSDPSSVEVSLTKTGTLTEELLSLRHISIGAQIQDLTGLPYKGRYDA